MKRQQRECESSLHIYGANLSLIQGRREVRSPELKASTHEGKLTSGARKLTRNDGEDKKIEKIVGTPNKGTSKSYHTIDMNGYISMSRQEQDLINKPCF